MYMVEFSACVVGLLPNPQCVQFGLKNGPVDEIGNRKFIRDCVLHRFLL
jgi:hypothetical protein